MLQPNALLEPQGREHEPLGYDGIFAVLLERIERADRRGRDPHPDDVARAGMFDGNQP